MGVLDEYLSIQSGLIVVILPFAFAYFIEMQKELMKMQGGSKYGVIQWSHLSSDTRHHSTTLSLTMLPN